MQGGEDNDDQLPENFFVAPKDVHMVDLTAVGDVLLGKLVHFHSTIFLNILTIYQGYGTVSECLDGCTPFVYGNIFILGLIYHLFN